MGVLLLGLVLFLGVHSLRLGGDGFRDRWIARFGPGVWKGLYSFWSVVGLALIIWGYALARHAPVVLWTPPVWTRHVAALLTLPAIVMVVAAYLPGNAIKARLRHPMTLGIKLWAFAHLLSNGTLADVLLFGSFLLWSVAVFRAARRRDALPGAQGLPVETGRTLKTLIVGVFAWAVFAFALHRPLIGVAPFGG